VEATIYQIDEANEQYARQGLLLPHAHSEGGAGLLTSIQAACILEGSLFRIAHLRAAAREALEQVLRGKGLWNEGIAAELAKVGRPNVPHYAMLQCLLTAG
jgi:hypothetical protein